MLKSDIIIKGNKYGLNVVIDMRTFDSFEELMDALKKKLSRGRKFYKGAVLKITTQLEYISNLDKIRLKDRLFEEFLIKDCIFEDIKKKDIKVFEGIYEGHTRFIKKSVRSGQIIRYSGNIVIIGDVNSGAEVHAAGNIVVLGVLRGFVHAGMTGNRHAIIAAYMLEPQILKIADIITRAPDDGIKPKYPEIAKIKGDSIIVEPYLPNKYM